MTERYKSAPIAIGGHRRGRRKGGRALVPPVCVAEALEGRVLFSNYIVTTLGDGAGTVAPSGAGKFTATTLRAALAAANARAGADTINFANAVTGIISLRTTLPRVTDDLTLAGPGAAKLTVRRSPSATTDFSIFVVATGTTAALAGLTIVGGTGTADENDLPLPGGGIFTRGDLTVRDCVISRNSAGYGSGIFNAEDGTLSLIRCAVDSNQGPGGGVFNYGELFISRSRITRNIASFGAGGIDSFGGTVNLSDCTVSSNSGETGGLVNFGATMMVSRCTVSDNTGRSEGGGIWNASSGTLTVVNSTVSGNSADEDAGGITNSSGQTLAMTNCTIAGNSAGPVGGISLFADFGTSITLVNCSVAGNRATQATGTGGILGGATLTLENTLVAGNTVGGSTRAAGDINGTAAAASASNIIGTGGSGGLRNGVNGNRVGVALSALKLGPLADNGGLTKTIVLLPGSIAINAGSSALAVGPDGKPLTTDQRGPGFARIAGGRVDVGAFEVQAPASSAGAILGHVFDDRNGNGRRDGGESALGGWVAYVDRNNNRKPDAGEPRATTDGKGHYRLAGLAAGRYVVRLVLQPGWQQSKPPAGGPLLVDLAAGQILSDRGFGVRRIDLATAAGG
jgi:hypothetical protein